MTGKKRLSGIILLFFLILNTLFSKELENYVVKKGDQLGLLLFQRNISPLWGEKGNVEKIRKLNQLETTVLVEGQEIKLPFLRNERIPTSELIPSLPKEVNIPREQSVVKKEGQPFERKSTFTVQPKVSFMKVDLVDPQDNSAVSLLSNVNTGVDLFWNQYWSPKVQSHLFLDFNHVNFESLLNRSLSKKKETVTAIGFEIKYSWLDWLTTGILIQYGEELFISAPNTTTIRLDKTTLLSSRLNLGLRILKLDPFEVHLQSGARIIASGKVGGYKTEQSFGYNSGILLNHQKGQSSFYGKLNYEIQDKNTSNLNQTHNVLTLSVGYTWDF